MGSKDIKKSKDETGISRRRFMRQSACASLGLTALVNSLAQMRLVTAAMAGTPAEAEYRALVCVFLNGGNDANNLIVPRSGQLRADYESGRGVLAIPSLDLHPILADNDSREFGLHPSCPDLAALFNSGKLAMVNNVGSLAFPIADREEYLSGSIPLPTQLFSHSDQQTQWQSSISDRPFQTGWGGRAVDLLHASYNTGSNVSMSVSLDGINNLQIGALGGSAQYTMNKTGPVALSGFGADYVNALNPDGTYKNNNSGWRLRGLLEVMRLTHDHLMEDSYGKVMVNAWDTEQFIRGAMTEATAAEAAGAFTFDDLFVNAATDLGDQLKQVARLIAGRTALGNNRQVFFCRVGGYDTHQTQLASHAALMDELNHALSAFHTATVQLGVDSQVTTFTASDFSRTFTPNGTDAEAGADHAWGGHAMVLGGAVQGKNLYGQFPDLRLGQGLDVDNDRGRWIPTTSVDQYSAIFAKWLGADDTAIEAIFPNLGRFDDPFTSSTANLGFLDLSG